MVLSKILIFLMACPENAANSHLAGRDSRWEDHLSDSRKCPSCPAETHRAALQVLIQKGQKAVLASNLDSNQGASTLESGVSITSAKRKKAGSILGYANLPLTDAQKSHANIKLFQ